LEKAQYNTFLAWVDPVELIMFINAGSSRLPLISSKEKRIYKKVEVPK
jgi:hypothetical protein